MPAIPGNTATQARASRGTFSLAARVFFAQLALVILVCTALSVASYTSAQANAREATADRVLSVAETLAGDPYVVTAVQTPEPSVKLQPYALRILGAARVDFVTIMDTNRIRYTHPNPEQLGKPYIGSVQAALDGRSQVEEYSGTLGPSVRAIAPVLDETGRVVAMVAVGVTVDTISLAQAAALPQTLAVALGAIALGGIGSWMLSRYLHRVTLGFGPERLRQLFSYYDSALHSLREGVVLVDGTGRLVLYNDQAAELLGLPPVGELHPVSVSGLALPESLVELFRSGRRATDETHLTRDRILIVNQQPATEPGGGARPRLAPRTVGVVATLRDRTEIQALTGELESLKTLSEALRAQTHEHANRLHTVATLIELGRAREALEFAVADRQDSQRLTDRFVRALDEPFITALLVGKAAQAHERGITLTITAAGELPSGSLDALDLVTVTGNLLDNAFDAAAASEKRAVWADFAVAADALIISIADSGAGIDTERLDELFRLGSSSKADEVQAGGGRDHGLGHGLGLALVRQAVTRLGGTLEVASDEGAIFTVTLPLRPDREGAIHDADAQATEGASDGH